MRVTTRKQVSRIKITSAVTGRLGSEAHHGATGPARRNITPMRWHRWLKTKTIPRYPR
jgi:hypothetical protein